MKINKLLYIALVSMMIGFMPVKSYANHCGAGVDQLHNPDGTCASMATKPMGTVPEPSTIGLLLLGAAGIWIARRKSK